MSEDGYRWRGSWKAPATSGRLEAKLFDGERLLGTLNFAVTVPATLNTKHGSLLEQLWLAIAGTPGTG